MSAPTPPNHTPSSDSLKSDITVKLKDVEKLTDGKWIGWSRNVNMCLRSQGLRKYIDGTSRMPSDEKEKAKWLEINDKIVRALGMAVDIPMQRELRKITNAKHAWDFLEEKYNAKTLPMKLEHMQTALRTRFARDTSVRQTKMEIEDALEAIFEDGDGPTQDEWLMILSMNALNDDDYDLLKKDLLSFITNSSVKVTVKDIMTRIEADERASCAFISIGKLCDDGHSLSFDSEGCKVGDEKGKTIAHGWEKTRRKVIRAVDSRNVE